MKYGKREYRLPKTENRQETEKAESGQVSWVLGLFLILFLAILLYMQLQLAMYKASARYLEDALALSNLASAVIDIREYGSTHKVHITDQEQAYAGYCSAVRAAFPSCCARGDNASHAPAAPVAFSCA